MSLFNVLEKLEVNAQVKSSTEKGLPDLINVPVDYQIVNLWKYFGAKKDKKISTRVDLVDPANTTRTIVEKELHLPTSKTGMREIVRIQGIPLTNSGVYVFKVMKKEKSDRKYTTVAELPLEVVINRQDVN